MEDDDLAQIRKARLEQLKAQGGGGGGSSGGGQEQKQQQECKYPIPWQYSFKGHPEVNTPLSRSASIHPLSDPRARSSRPTRTYPTCQGIPRARC
ncbi:hypothetical protein ONS96_006664 [Cadophora gregata f. sp. sojae]|nr:hypothetical protein ONS96_006664 [Cadophora gregata f. sp. sojae]